MEIGINITFVEIAPPAPAGWLSRAFVHLIYHHRSFVCSLCWLANGQTASASIAAPHPPYPPIKPLVELVVVGEFLTVKIILFFLFFYVHAAWARTIVILQSEQSRPPVSHPWKGQLRRAHELNSRGKIKKGKIQIFKQSQDTTPPTGMIEIVQTRAQPIAMVLLFWCKQKTRSRRHISQCW